jgi:hypothetical protein
MDVCDFIVKRYGRNRVGQFYISGLRTHIRIEDVRHGNFGALEIGSENADRILERLLANLGTKDRTRARGTPCSL